MKIAILCNGAVLQPALEALYSQGLLAGVATPAATVAGDPSLMIEMAVKQAGVPFLRVGEGDLTAQLAPWLKGVDADLLCCMGFPRKLPPELLALPRLGCYNFHGGPLPGYRGPDPVFWQIKNQEPCATVTVHRMEPQLDTGAIVHTATQPVGVDDTYGLWMQRLGGVLPRVMIEFVQQVAIHGEALPLQEQATATARYLPRPTDADRTIDWSRSAAEIDALARACNPVYGGALTSIKGVPLRILEFSPAPALPENTAPGTVISAADNALRIACGNGESLVAGIIYSMDGFFTGNRLMRVFGLQPGERLG